eukprot:scaffold20420_cov89-Skeletonema_marinoi.AAC.1
MSEPRAEQLDGRWQLYRTSVPVRPGWSENWIFYTLSELGQSRTFLTCFFASSTYIPPKIHFNGLIFVVERNV